MKAVHLIGVPLDLGGNRRGTDMGPSAFRIAGLAEQLAALGWSVTDKGDITSPIPEAKGPGDAQEAIRQGDRQGLPEAVPDVARLARRRRAAPRARRRPQPRRRLGRRRGRTPAQARQAARLDLGRRARRHEHAGHRAAPATCTACRWRRCSVANRSSWRASPATRRRCCPSTPCSSAFATSTTSKRKSSARRRSTSSR